MQLEINENKAIMPSLYIGQSQQFMIVRDDKTKDCIKEVEREAKNNKGKFKQYTLFLQNKDGEKYEANFLFAQQLRALVSQYGQDTTGWHQCGVEISGSPRQANGKEYVDLVLIPKTTPAEWLTVAV